MGFEVLFYFFIVSHLAAFLLGMWLSVYANGKQAKRKGVCSCAPKYSAANAASGDAFVYYWEK